MKSVFLAIFFCVSFTAYAQDLVTDNPGVLSSNCDYCRIAKVVVGEKNTKVLIEVAKKRGVKPWVTFSRWTILVPYIPGKDLTELRNYDLNMPLYYGNTYQVEKMQTEAKKLFKEFLIQDLGDKMLDTKYEIKSRDGEVYSFWMTFGKLPPGVEKITIIELIEAGFEWSGISIKNPDNTPKTTWNEESLKADWKSNGISAMEGIYENTISSDIASKYKLAVKFDKESDSYNLIYLGGSPNDLWHVGDVKAVVSKTASSNIFKVKWYMNNKIATSDLYISFDEALMRVTWTDGNPEQLYLKLFPTAADNITEKSKNEKSSGTGYAISPDGFIVTNYHVAGGASTIKVRGIKGDFTKSYAAKVILEDKNNDLAIIKIDDPGFTSLGAIPYQFSRTSSDVGSAVFVLGYPLRATMGDEIKLTNGIISAKSGFQGDITSYQITAPIQPGNSGGPLFDEKGNVIGVINAKHRGTENVSYAIKVSYLLNLIDLLPTPVSLQNSSTLSTKSLPEQVKIIKNFTYIIEVN